MCLSEGVPAYHQVELFSGLADERHSQAAVKVPCACMVYL